MRAMRAAMVGVLLLCIGGCGGGTSSPWGLDPQIQGLWDLIEMTEDGFPVFFRGKTMSFAADGAMRSDTFSGAWSIGTYRTRPGKLNYTITDSSDPSNIGVRSTITYAVVGNTLTLEGPAEGHYYVTIFRRSGP